MLSSKIHGLLSFTSWSIGKETVLKYINKVEYVVDPGTTFL